MVDAWRGGCRGRRSGGPPDASEEDCTLVVLVLAKMLGCSELATSLCETGWLQRNCAGDARCQYGPTRRWPLAWASLAAAGRQQRHSRSDHDAQRGGRRASRDGEQERRLGRTWAEPRGRQWARTRPSSN